MPWHEASSRDAIRRVDVARQRQTDTKSMVRFSTGSKGRNRWLAALAALALVVGAAALCPAQIGGKLISEDEAQRFGLTRAWFTQVELNRARNHVVRCILAGDQLVVLTSAGLVHSLDADSGRTLWMAQVGNADYESLGPAADDQFVALLNGSTLYVLDRRSGQLVMTRRVGGGPGASPALANRYVFVPLISGRIEGYSLRDEKQSIWYYQSFGRVLVTPLATPDSIVWSTSSGYLYVGDARNPAVRYRLEATSEFTAQPAYRKPTIYAISAAGELHALDEESGRQLWRYSTGYPSDRSPAVVGACVYVTSDEPALHCVDATTGTARWTAPNVSQFAAASKTRVYGIDPYGSLIVLNAKTGMPTARMTTDGTIIALVNDQTDRLYLVSDSGLVQCLHEIGAVEPLYHQQAPAAAAPPAEEPAAQPQPYEPERVAPQPQPQPPPSGVESPFTPAAEPPPTTPPADESPFGLEDDNPFDF